jgi:hypothetical protein
MFQENMDPFILLKSCELFGFIMPSQHYQQIANTTSVPACTIHVSFLTTKKKFHGAGSTYTTLVHWPLTKGLKYQNQSFFTNLLVQSLQHLLMIIHKCIKLGKTQTMSENMNEICDSCKLTTDKLTKHQNYKTTEHQIFDAPNIFNCPRNAQTRRPHF